MKRISIIAITALSVLLLNILPMQNSAHAAGKNAAEKMAQDLVKSILSKLISNALFPSENAIDYDNIRKIMQEVARDANTTSEISIVEGQIKSAARDSSTIIRSRTDVNNKYTKLDNVRFFLGRDIGKLTEQQFNRPGLGSFVVGAQVELNTLAAMRAFAFEYKNDSDIFFAEDLLTDKLKAYEQYANQTLNDIYLTEANIYTQGMGGCYSKNVQHGRHTKYMFNHAGGTHGWNKTMAECQRYRVEYTAKLKSDSRLAVQQKLGWMLEVLISWREALKELKRDMNSR
jgi:hypothetical protein